MVFLLDVTTIDNSTMLVDLLNRNIEIAISGDITLKDLNLDRVAITSGSLYLNGEEIIGREWMVNKIRLHEYF